MPVHPFLRGQQAIKRVTVVWRQLLESEDRSDVPRPDVNAVLAGQRQNLVWNERPQAIDSPAAVLA